MGHWPMITLERGEERGNEGKSFVRLMGGSVRKPASQMKQGRLAENAGTCTYVMLNNFQESITT